MAATEPASGQDVFRNGAGQAAKQVEYATGASSSRLVAAGQGSRLTRQDMISAVRSGTGEIGSLWQRSEKTCSGYVLMLFCP